jgi:hypothetical protein
MATERFKTEILKLGNQFLAFRKFFFFHPLTGRQYEVRRLSQITDNLLNTSKRSMKSHVSNVLAMEVILKES